MQGGGARGGDGTELCQLAPWLELQTLWVDEWLPHPALSFERVSEIESLESHRACTHAEIMWFLWSFLTGFEGSFL